MLLYEPTNIKQVTITMMLGEQFFIQIKSKQFEQTITRNMHHET